MGRVALGAVGVAAAALCGLWLWPASTESPANTPASYSGNVRPILQKSCGSCHFGMSHKGGLSLETKASTLKGGRDGVVIVPGDPQNSMLVRLIRHEGPASHPMPMPPWPRRKLSSRDIATISEWIKAGAEMPGPATAASGGK